jgi:hypothetical protein
LLTVGRRVGILFETLAVLFLLISFGYESYNNNISYIREVPPVRKPELMHGFLMATQLIHDWNMFAPNPLKNDGWWVIDGETIAGKKFDPLTGKEPTWEKPAYLASTLSVSWTKYLTRITEESNQSHRLYFGRYLTIRNHREMKEDDRLLRFQVYYVQEWTPPPGTSEPFRTRTILLWRHNCFASPPPSKSLAKSDS